MEDDFQTQVLTSNNKHETQQLCSVFLTSNQAKILLLCRLPIPQFSGPLLYSSKFLNECRIVQNF